jgi:hypothetical protein
LPRYGADATRSLMTGFLQGLHGFAAFFIVIYLLLAVLHPAVAFVIALLAALGTALAVQAGVRFAYRQPTKLDGGLFVDPMTGCEPVAGVLAWSFHTPCKEHLCKRLTVSIVSLF